MTSVSFSCLAHFHHTCCACIWVGRSQQKVPQTIKFLQLREKQTESSIPNSTPPPKKKTTKKSKKLVFPSPSAVDLDPKYLAVSIKVSVPWVITMCLKSLAWRKCCDFLINPNINRTIETYTNWKGIKVNPAYSNGIGLRIKNEISSCEFLLLESVRWYKKFIWRFTYGNEARNRAQRPFKGPLLKPMTWEYIGGKHQLLAPQDNTNHFRPHSVVGVSADPLQ